MPVSAIRAIFLLILVSCMAIKASAEVTITLQSDEPASRIVADELRFFLSKMYGEDVSIRESIPDEGVVIALALIDGLGEGYRVETSGNVTAISASSQRGLFYGAYGLLRELGYGFYLSFETIPEAGSTLQLEGIKLADSPLIGERIAFNWHNFLSGCTGWDLEDWIAWITRCQRMGFNTIMVHAYGNNPMFSYTFNGKEKPVGYIATTRQGRDWAVNHVNDVRRMHGGDVFDDPVFGARPALVSGEQRVDAIQKFMYEVFDFAEERDMEINFAVDVDLPSGNPVDLIMTLDETDRFYIESEHRWFPDGGLWLVRPDTPAGYAYYEAQAQAMMSAYPQVDTITLWRRLGAGMFVIKPEHLPEGLRKQYLALVEEDPSINKLRQRVGTFLFGKILDAWRRALDNLGYNHVKLATGSWGHDFVQSSAAFMDPEVKIYALDHFVVRKPNQSLANEKRMQRLLQGVEPERYVPIIWAHHDDGEYCGAPLPSLENFSSRLDGWNAGGFGILHWTTRPLDIYFANHIRQVWQQTENEAASETSKVMAGHLWGTTNEEALGEYLYQWWTDMPHYGRETHDFFIDRPISKFGDPEAMIADCRARALQLDNVDQTSLTHTQREWLDFYQGYETFTAEIFETQLKYESAQEAYKAGDLESARRYMEGTSPTQIIERFAEISAHADMTRGEEGILVSLNTRWLPHYVKLRQQLGMLPVQYNFGTTRHEPLAQGKGDFTFYFSPTKQLWQILGAEETGLALANLELAIDEDMPDWYSEIAEEGLILDEPFELILQPIVSVGSRSTIKSSPLKKGAYELELLISTISSPSDFAVTLTCKSDGKNTELIMQEQTRISKSKMLTSIRYAFDLDMDGYLALKINSPLHEKIVLNGIILHSIR